MISPEALAIRKVPWDFFLTLTHRPEKGSAFTGQTVFEADPNRPGVSSVRGGAGSKRWESPSRKRQEHRFSAFIYQVCKTFKIKPRHLEWVRRWEVGRGGKEHYHMLLRLKKKNLTNRKSVSHILKNQWCKALGYGIADVRLCDCENGAAGYLAKINDYEKSRFSQEKFRVIEFSRAASRLLRKKKA